MTYDVAIVGGGPAASVTALLLARAGASCVILERGDDAVGGRGDKPGESLAPAVRPLLEELGVWDELERDGHRPCHGNRSVWGSDAVDEMPFVFTPYGHGWHLDRRRFERMLAARAVEAGAERRINVRLGDVPRARFYVDATGRASWLAKQRGARRVVDDTLVASVAFLRGGDMDDSFTLVEAAENGWWYSAPIPGGRLAAMFVTDRADAAWAPPVQTRERIETHGYALAEPPRWVDASSARLDRVAGDDWLAVGDAATSLDPLSSHGLGNAIAGGMNAARAILSGDIARYVASVDAMWIAYVALRRATYAMETRWPESRFWGRGGGGGGG
ncbi:MAG TPA: NAD(P)/FAD-dependent oxidoreductase, partial [Thermoanaerobaculia bacterium]|nr:NAD(P)/FAD-dependent oxidoreductase [Thermoanaerobaculia bacterium]